MRFEPVNPNPTWPTAHMLCLAATGGGKSQVVAQCGGTVFEGGKPKVAPIPKGARVILWDQAGDHAGLHYSDKRAFLRALHLGIKRGKGFRIAYSGVRDVQTWEWFCEVVWSVLDGDVLTYVIAEELSAVCPSTAQATPNASVLMNEGRKYGLRFIGTSQKPQSIAKTFFTECNIKWIGQQMGEDMRKRMGREIGVESDRVAALKPLEFFVHGGGADEPELIKLRYKLPSGVKWAS
jgi:hypothetical protein